MGEDEVLATGDKIVDSETGTVNYVVIVGDITGDGKIDSRDLKMLRVYLMDN